PSCWLRFLSFTFVRFSDVPTFTSFYRNMDKRASKLGKPPLEYLNNAKVEHENLQNKWNKVNNWKVLSVESHRPSLRMDACYLSTFPIVSLLSY
ncbi:hypothetical protein L873DRAFT_1821228, partial [Choiromyces venosus 120613-1]